MAAAIELLDVRVAYRGLVALEALSLSVGAGEVVALLGPNGAGKTTAVDVACGLRRPDRGRATILGADVARDRAALGRVGVVPQDSGLYPELGAVHHLELAAALYGLRRPEARIHELLDLMGLLDRRRARVSTYSGGMRRRLALARALLHDPAVLLLDEPTLGVDVQGRRVLWEHITRLRSEGRSVLLTTNNLEEANAVCDRVAILDAGRLVALAPPAELRRAGGLIVGMKCGEGAARVAAALRGRPDVAEVSHDNGIVRARLARDEAAAEVVVAAQDVALVSRMWTEEPSLEDVFLHLTGRQLRD